MNDPIAASMKNGHLVIWEEIARDGAQAKTLLSGPDRVNISRMMGDLFGEYGPDHLVFAAGYPSMGKGEFEIVARLAAEVHNCSLATHGRMLRKDIDLGIKSIQQAKYGRVTFAIPISEEYSRVMMHQGAAITLKMGIEMARYALDNAGGLPVDIALGGASLVEASFLSDAVDAVLEEGIATVKLCDSVGLMYPMEAHTLFQGLLKIRPENTRKIGVHLHNDLGFALISSLDAIQQGVRMVCASWFGIAERIGLANTEQILFILTHPQDRLAEKTGIPFSIWKQPPDLTKINGISNHISKVLNYPLRSTDPIVSPNINDISTGAYFNNPDQFKPFDPQSTIGVPPKLILTHLANKKIVRIAAREFGFDLTPEQAQKAMIWVKEFAYKNLTSEISKAMFQDFLNEMING